MAFDPGTGRFLAEYKNGAFAAVGACDEPVKPGDKVLFAYANGSEPLLALTGPATAQPGQPVTLQVTDGSKPVAGATVAGSVSAADGTVTVGPFTDRGDHDLKATKPGAIRSNRVRVCVTAGADGACGTTVLTKGGPAMITPGTPDRSAPSAALSGIKESRPSRPARVS